LIPLGPPAIALERELFMLKMHNNPEIQKDQRHLVYIAVIIYLSLFAFLLIISLQEQNYILSASVVLMAKELAYAFRKIVDKGIDVMFQQK
jgi:hypothetical protein